MKEGIAKSESGIAEETPASEVDTFGTSPDAGPTVGVSLVDAGALSLDLWVFFCPNRCDAAAAAASRGFSRESPVMAEGCSEAPVGSPPNHRGSIPHWRHRPSRSVNPGKRGTG